MYQRIEHPTKYLGAIRVAEAFRQKVRESNERNIKVLEERDLVIPSCVTDVEVVNIQEDRADVYGKGRRGFFKDPVLYHLVYDLKSEEITEKDFFAEKMFGGLENTMVGLFFTATVIGAPLGLFLIADALIPSRRKRYLRTNQWYKESFELKKKLVEDEKRK